MTTITSFVNRLEKIGVKVELFGNYPWIYLDKVNGVKVKGTFLADHGFTCFFIRGYRQEGLSERITDTTAIFKKIRETLNASTPTV